MKKRIFAGAVVLFIGGLLASACDDGEADYYEVVPSGNYCHRYATCGTCTPIEGCGWCQTGVNKGMCVADPDDCSGNSAFSWTWDPSGCVPGSTGAADGGAVTATDAATATESDDAGDALAPLDDAATQALH